MNEEKDISEQSVDPVEENADQAVEQDISTPITEEADQTEGETLPAAEEGEGEAAAVAEVTEETAPSEEETAQESLPQPTWEFGENESKTAEKNKKGTRAFVAVFAAVFAVCVLLIGVTFLFGDGAIRIVQTFKTTAETVRTVFVKEYNETAVEGLLAPQQAADTVKKSTVTVFVRTATGSGHGSGFLYREESGVTYICTNHHVVENAVAVEVILADGTVYDATVVGSNADGDVAVVRIAATGLPLATTGVSDTLLAGDEVFAVGTPTNIAYAGTVTFGHVSHPSRLVPITDTSGNVSAKMTLIQTDTALNNGNSGGPLADLYGDVVGMVVLKLTTGSGNTVDGIAFALPIDGVRTIADAIIANGSFSGDNPITEGPSALGLSGHGVQKGYWYFLNTSTGRVSASEVEIDGYYQAAATGIYVHSITPGTHAVGLLQEGDVILKVNGLSMRDIYDVIGEVNRHYIGETVTLTVWRNNAAVEVEVILSPMASN